MCGNSLYFNYLFPNTLSYRKYGFQAVDLDALTYFHLYGYSPILAMCFVRSNHFFLFLRSFFSLVCQVHGFGGVDFVQNLAWLREIPNK